MADPIREALERLVVQLAATYDPDGPVPAWADSYFGAIAVLAASPPAPVPSLPLQASSLPFVLSPISGWGAYVNGNLAAIYSDRDGAPGQLRWSTGGEVHPDLVEPPAPAPAIPLDLDALLSPEGAYELGTGQEDGAQLVDLCWWAPVHGCDTLENLLDRIRLRILPHLRPPIAGIDVPGTDGDYGGLQELCDAEGIDVRIGAPLLKRAREAWGAAQPAPAADEEREEREELARWLEFEADNAQELGCATIYDHDRLRWAAGYILSPAPAPVPGWQPMDTAPQDGTEILASDYDSIDILSWNCEPSPWDSETGEGPAWCDREGLRMYPAWWQPLPNHPPIPQPPQGGEVADA